MPRSAPLFLVLAGCVVDEPDVVVPEPCGVYVDATEPADGALDAYYRGDVVFWLSEPDPTAVVLAPVHGRTHTRDDGRQVVFTPDAPLAPATSYEFGLATCRGRPTISFTTSEIGESLAIPNDDLADRAWEIDLDGASYAWGEALGHLVTWLLTDRLWVGVSAVKEDELTLRVALPDGDAQDACTRTLDLAGVDFSGAPYFSFGPEPVVFAVDGTLLVVQDLEISGALSPDGARVEGATLRGMMDGRELLDLFGSDAYDAMCELAGAYEVPCEPCPADGAPYCLHLDAYDLRAALLPGVILLDVDVAPAECPADR